MKSTAMSTTNAHGCFSYSSEICGISFNNRSRTSCKITAACGNSPSALAKEVISWRASTASGYQFNPDLHIMTDYQQFDDLIQLASKASSVINRVELLKNAIDLYCGKILSSADGEHWLIQFAAKYHIAYVGAVNELLKQLNALHSYDLLNQYAARSLAIVPENSRGYYWLIHSLKVQGMDELASNEYQLAKQHLTTEEYKELCTSLGDSCE